MFKIIFVLVINAYHGGMTTIDFTTLQQCETAKELVKVGARGSASVSAVCIEKQVPIKKTRCKIVNSTDYRNKVNSAMVAYPYPVEVECVEE